MNTNNDDKAYLERPLGQPGYVPQSYVRPAPGIYLKNYEETPAYVADIAMRWRGTSNSGGGVQM
jgi:hypothetical protein